jgi:hypothetical protein
MTHKARQGKLPRRATEPQRLLASMERYPDAFSPGVYGSVGETHTGMAFSRVSGTEGAKVGLFALLDDSTLLEVSFGISSVEDRVCSSLDGSSGDHENLTKWGPRLHNLHVKVTEWFL